MDVEVVVLEPLDGEFGDRLCVRVVVGIEGRTEPEATLRVCQTDTFELSCGPEPGGDLFEHRPIDGSATHWWRGKAYTDGN